MTTETTSPDDRATQTAQLLTEKYFTADVENWWVAAGGFWHAANALETLIDTMTLADVTTFQNVVDPVYHAFLTFFSPPYDLPNYYDDEGWWGIAIQKASEFANSDQYYHTAVQIFQDLCQGWDDTCGGGVWFKRNPKSYPGNFKGSISNELFMVLGARLYNQNKAPSQADREVFLDWAIKAWLWIKNSGLIRDEQMWGGLESDCKTVDPQNLPYTYTQGVILGGLGEIYKATGDQSYLDAALPFADTTLQKMVWPDGVLREVCEAKGEPCDGNAMQFKGIFMRYLGQFYCTLSGVSNPNSTYIDAIERYASFITLNANTLWAGYPGGIFGMDWHRPPGPYTPESDPLTAGILQSSALDCFNSDLRLPSDGSPA